MTLPIILFLIIGTFFVFLIIGMIKPSLVMKWSERPTRLKVLGIWFIINLTLWVFFFMSIPDSTIKEKIIISRENLKNGNYSLVKSGLEQITEKDSLYVEAQLLIKKADSLQSIQEEKTKIEEEKLRGNERKEYLIRELNSINDGIDFSSYRGSVEKLQFELILFGSWEMLISENETSEDKEIKVLVSELKLKVKKIQKLEFPILRKEYVKLIANLMWENDITVTASGRSNKYINFSGGIFAANKNKKDFHNEIKEVLKMFRFSQARYRWYEGKSDYTYWIVEEKRDSDLYKFN